MQNGQLYLRVHWEPATNVVGGGVLPTPTTMDHLPPRSVDSMIKQTTIHRKGRTKLANLREALNPQTSKIVQSSTKSPNSSNRGYEEDFNKNGTRNMEAVLLNVLTQIGDHMSVSYTS